MQAADAIAAGGDSRQIDQVQDELGRLIDSLAAAALRRELSWGEVALGVTVLSRFGHLAGSSYWSVYRALAPKPQSARRRWVA